MVLLCAGVGLLVSDWRAKGGWGSDTFQVVFAVWLVILWLSTGMSLVVEVLLFFSHDSFWKFKCLMMAESKLFAWLSRPLCLFSFILTLLCCTQSALMLILQGMVGGRLTYIAFHIFMLSAWPLSC